MKIKLISVDDKERSKYAAVFFLSFYLILLCSSLGISRFWADSWTYYELAQTIYTQNFYEFNTFRSYFSYEKSAAFPFGYPTVLASINEIVGWSPVNATYFNALISVVNLLLILKLTEYFNFTRPVGISVGFGTLLSTPYLEEVMSGGSIPLAICLVLLGVSILLQKSELRYTFWGALLVGMSSIIRFDFLVSCVVILVVFFGYKKHKLNIGAVLISGLLISMSPWIYFSLSNFSKIWVSDNSWVALSASNTYVLDYPASAVETVFSAPAEWANKIAGNLYKLAFRLFEGIKEFPLVMVAVACYIASIGGITKILGFRNTVFYFLCAMALLGPYVLTGYFSVRYFIFPFLLFLFFSTGVFNRIEKLRELLGTVYPAIIVIMVLQAFWYLGSSYAWATTTDQTQNIALIEKVRECHEKELDMTYIFTGKAKSILYQSGAITRHRTADLPHNFDDLDDSEKEEYFTTISPYREIQTLSGDIC